MSGNDKTSSQDSQEKTSSTDSQQSVQSIDSPTTGRQQLPRLPPIQTFATHQPLSGEYYLDSRYYDPNEAKLAQILAQKGHKMGQPRGQFYGQTMGQPIGQPMGHPMYRPMGQPMGYPMGQPMGYPMGQSMGQPMGYPMGHPMYRPMGQPMAYQPPVGAATGQFVGQMIDRYNQQNAQTMNQTTGQPMAYNQPMAGQAAGHFVGQMIDRYNQTSTQPGYQPVGQQMNPMMGPQYYPYGQQMAMNPMMPKNQYMVVNGKVVPYETVDNLPDGTVVAKDAFDPHSRFDIAAKPLVPPPPPGASPTAAQLAQMSGKKVLVGKKDNTGIWPAIYDSSAGGYTMWD